MMSDTDPVAVPDDARPPSPVSPDASGAARPIVLQALEATLRSLAKAARLPDPVDMVHDARKTMKAYRGLLRLLPSAHAKAARRETAAAARTLSAARDHAAALEALAELVRLGCVSAADQAATAAAIGAGPEESAEAESHRATIKAFLEAARARLREGLGTEAATVDLVAGLTRAYRKARRGRFETPREMHETRKRVVTHRYQMSFFAKAFAGHGAGRARRAQALRDLLGAYQDIETLRPMVDARRAMLGAETTGRVLQGMALRQKRLRSEAIDLHRKLFCRHPKVFSKKYRKVLSA